MKTWLSPKDSGFPANLSDDGWFSCHNLSLIKLELGVCAFYFSSLPLSNHCILPPPPTFLIWFSYHLVVPSSIPHCNCYPCIPRPILLVIWLLAPGSLSLFSFLVISIFLVDNLSHALNTLTFELYLPMILTSTCLWCPIICHYQKLQPIHNFICICPSLIIIFLIYFF